MDASDDGERARTRAVTRERGRRIDRHLISIDDESTTDGRTTRRADRCALDGAIASSKRPSRVFLDDVAEELAREGGSGRMTGERWNACFSRG